MSLTELEIPDSVQYSGGLANTGLETVEFGTQIRKISSRGTSLTAPQHLIVRGGVQGVVDYEESASDTSLMSAFFGEGIMDITLSGSFPSVVVLPSTTTQFALYSYLLGGRPDDIDVYVADAQGSPAWVTAENALRQARLDTARIHRYTPATVTVSGAGITEADDGYELLASVGTPTQITASVTGGVPGGYQMRATQVGADGTETRVLDWADMTANADSASALLSWNPTSSDTTLRIEVRDATHLRHPVTVALAAVLSRIRPRRWDRGRTTGAAGATGTRMALLNAVRRSPSTRRYTDSTRMGARRPGGCSTGTRGTTTPRRVLSRADG